MILTVEFRKNKTIDVFPDISVLELRQQIADLFELKLENFDLQYEKVFLRDEKNLSVYQINENSVIRVVNQKIHLHIINKGSETFLKNLDVNMKVGELKKQYSPEKWQSLTFYYYYEFSVENPNKKKIDMKFVEDKLNIKPETSEEKRKELHRKYFHRYNGDRLYYFKYRHLNDNERTLAEYKMNDNYKIYITFPVFVKHSEKVYSFDVFDRLGISEFKKRITNKINKSMLDFELGYSDSILNDSNFIGDYDIFPKDTLLITTLTSGGYEDNIINFSKKMKLYSSNQTGKSQRIAVIFDPVQ